MPAGSSILNPRSRSGSRRLAALVQKRSILAEGTTDLNALAQGAINLGDPFKGDPVLENFQAQSFQVLTEIISGVSASRTVARALKAAAFQILAQGREIEARIRIEGIRDSSAAVARAGAVGFEAAGTPAAVARRIRLASQEEGRRVNQLTMRLVAQVLRLARRVEKARKRRKRGAILDALGEFVGVPGTGTGGVAF